MTRGAYTQVQAAQEMAKAVADQNAEDIRFFYHQGANPDYRDSVGLSLLQNAANEGKLTSAAALLEVGANVNLISGPSNWSALHYAAYRNNRAMVQLLLDAKADPNVSTPKGEKPLHTAAFAGDLEVVMALVKAGADVFGKDERGHTAMEIATLRAEERLQFAQRPFVEIAVYLKREMEERERRARDAEAQRARVSDDIAALKRRHPERFRLKPR